MDAWTPATEGVGFALSPTLEALAPFRDAVTVVSGLSVAKNAGASLHSRASTRWLTGVPPREGQSQAAVQAGASMDQIAAQLVGARTQFASLEFALEPNDFAGSCDPGFSCAYVTTISWRDATTPLPMENNPRVVFERLFGDGGTTEQRVAEMRRDRSILDSVTDDLASLEREIGAGDRARLDQYLDAIRALERRIQLAEAQSADAELPELARPVGIPGTYEEHVKLMFDLVALAYQADITRVFTFMLGRELGGRTYPHLGVPDPHHGLSHHRNDPEKLAKLARINTYHMGLFTHFLENLTDTPDGDGSLLDHSMVLYGGGLGDSNDHAHFDLPELVVGGGAGRLAGNRHLRYPKDTPMTNLLVSILEKAGLRTETLGDSTGQIGELVGV